MTVKISHTRNVSGFSKTSLQLLAYVNALSGMHHG